MMGFYGFCMVRKAIGLMEIGPPVRPHNVSYKVSLPALRTIRVTVYIIFALPKPLYTALIVSTEDNILTNSLTWNSHSTKTVLSIDAYLNSDDY